LKTWIIVLIAALLAGCGPSAQQRRACEMYADAGGSASDMESVDYWVPVFSTPEERAKPAKDRADYEAALLASFHASGIFTDAEHLARERAAWSYPLPDPTPQERAEGQAAFIRKANTAAREGVAQRLTMSLREVADALTRCQR
jgi:hypothetical protein